jgi:hypothetical protein
MTVSAAFATRGWRRIHRLAASEPVNVGRLRYNLYVIEVERLDPSLRYEFYVGVTSTSAERRLAQHQEGGDKAWRQFRNGRGRAVRIRYDLMEGLPKFRSEDVAKAAEGTLARVISANVGPAYSDRVNDRRRRSA